MKWFYRLLFAIQPRRRWGEFWCDKHWSVLVLDSGIDRDIAALGITIALHETGRTGGRHSCCKVPEDLLSGIFERSKGWVKA